MVATHGQVFTSSAIRRHSLNQSQGEPQEEMGEIAQKIPDFFSRIFLREKPKFAKFAGQRLLKSKIHRHVCFTFVAPSKVCRIEGSIVSKKPPGYGDAAMEWEAKCKVLLLKGRVIP